MDFPWVAALIVAGITVIVSVSAASYSPFKRSRGASGVLEKREFEKLSKEIMECNAKIMEELAQTKETLASIEKMMKDVG
ncbi:MAG: hypothetical protein FWD97_08390 [Defluviitaleaceae bacterium]|nr:hypothetical protein [Defluviitaleaceae bacterium]